MKGGYVGHIRVPPADVMTCIDLVKKAGYATEGMSLAECIRLALSGLCAGARASGLAPTRDGFEYAEMTGPFLKYSQQKKIEFSRMAQADMASREAKDFLPRGEKIAAMAFDPTTRARKERRMKELAGKRIADPANFSAQEQVELDSLTSELIVGY